MRRAQFYFVLTLVFAVFVAVLAIQNTEPVTVDFLAWQFPQVSKVLIVLVSAAVGAVITLLLGLGWEIGRIRHTRQLEAQVRELEQRLETQGLETQGAAEEEVNRQEQRPSS